MPGGPSSRNTVSLLDSVIVDNSTAGTGGGVYVSTSIRGKSLAIANSQFLDNIAQPLTATPGNSNGGALTISERCTGTLATPVSVSIAGSVFSRNRAQPVGVEGHGGAILISAYADVAITDTRIVDNDVVLPAQPFGNNNGGGLWARVKSLRIERSEISENSADFGAGLRLNNDVPQLQGERWRPPSRSSIRRFPATSRRRSRPVRRRDTRFWQCRARARQHDRQRQFRHNVRRRDRAFDGRDCTRCRQAMQRRLH